MRTAKEMTYGLKLASIAAPALWGARFILDADITRKAGRVHQFYLDLPWDRHEMVGPGEDRLRLGNAIAKAGDAFREWASKQHWRQTDAIRASSFAGVMFYASTRASYGYLYVTAHLAELQIPDLDFTKEEIQFYRDSWRGEVRACRFKGRCLVCRRATYGFDDGENDPRGPLGDQALYPIGPEQSDLLQHDHPAWFGCADVYETHKLAISLAREMEKQSGSMEWGLR